MKRDLPTTIPSAVLSTAQAAIEETEDVIQRAGDAKRAYQSDAFRRQQHEARKRAHDGLMAMSQDLIKWSMTLLNGLPTDMLARRFDTRTGDPCIPVVRHEIALAACEGFQGGVLRTELQLMLYRGEGPFRHYDWFNGFRMTGGGQLASANSIYLAVHPEMLDQLHAFIAEGRNWPQIEAGLNALVDAFKDR